VAFHQKIVSFLEKLNRLLEKLNRPTAVAVVLVTFLIVDGLLFYRYQQSLRSAANDAAVNAPAGGEEVAEQTTTTTTASIAEESTTTSSPPPEEQNNNGVLQVVVAVVNTPVGLSIQADGQLVHEQVTNPGFSEEFEAEEAIDITAADGGAVLVGVEGKDLEPLGESGERVTRTFTKDSEITFHLGT
jgi:cytoskeleton protein RodZ